MSVIYDNLINSAHKGTIHTCCLLLDLTKAFDTVDHKTLIKKMKHIFGIGDISLELFENYVSNRIQYSRVNNSQLLTPKLTCGVP